MNFCSLNLLLIFLPFALLLEPIENYYWKDFNGLVPHDAFEVEPGQYIGSVPIARQGVFIGGVQNGSNQIEVSISAPRYLYSIYANANANIKVLCTDDPSSLQWIPTTNDTFIKIPYEVIVGGYDDDVLYIGKVTNRPPHGLAIGRASSLDNYVLHYTNGEGDLHKNPIYDVLVQNPKG